jgi:sulfur carrier protein ThiS
MPEAATSAPNAVTVAIVPGSAQAVLVCAGATVADALREAGVTADGYQIRVGGSAATPATPVNAGDRVILTKMIKGN